MNQFYNQDLRVKGGTNFSSAMFRFNASPREYSQRLGEILIERMMLSESVRIHSTETFLIITVNDIPVIVKDYYFVESKRQESVYAYEEWLKKIIIDSIALKES